MEATLDPLILDLVQWCAKERRAYSEVIEAWRTSCPRLTVWEDAIDRGLLVRKSVPDRGTFIEVTARGREFLRKHAGKAAPAAAERCVNRVTPHPAH
jgi:hypothetical protein